MEEKRRKLSQIRLESVLPDELIENTPLINVFTATVIDPKNISKVILEINQLLPIPDLQHLKRMKSRNILLFPVAWIDNSTNEEVRNFLQTKNISIQYLNIEDIKTVSVAAIPPKTKSQYTVINQLWPCNFHSNKYLEQLVENTIFSSEELETHTKFLRLAMEIRKKSNGNKCGVIVTDPQRNDLILSGGYSMAEKNPILHAAMVAIDGVARTQNGGAYNEYPIDIDWENLLQGDFKGVAVKEKVNNVYEIDESEYLCTNYNIYMTNEPCTMCAMGLIHSRAKRIFYIYPSQNGALGTTCKIHAVKDLNHHYEVFKVAAEDIDYFQCE
ncbi:probable inactive tRNA-specific adenosine deaminase-like protein 3 [Atheta coriaria]|uniref:probable inactive tRNA-specific adenosine deaminase-like protein 3 n=1 Tax=Dalotia coriaria TaxID=877792 RepID=UPI0031F426E8